MIQAARTTNKITAVILLMGLIGFGVTQHFGVIAQTATVTSTRSILIVDTVADLANLTPIDGTLVRTKGYSTDGVGSALYRYHKTGRSSITANSVTYFNGGASDDYFELDLEGGTLDITKAGAAGGGTIDDTAAIQAAINASDDNGSSAVVIPSGRTFLVTSTITVPINMAIIGDNAADFGSVILTTINDGSPVFDCPSGDGRQFQNITIRSKTGSILNCVGIRGGDIGTETYANRFYLSNVRISRMGVGIQWNGFIGTCIRAFVDYCTTGVEIDNANGTYWDLHIENCTTQFLMRDGTDVTIKGMFESGVAATTYGIVVEDGQSVTFIDPYLEFDSATTSLISAISIGQNSGTVEGLKLIGGTVSVSANAGSAAAVVIDKCISGEIDGLYVWSASSVITNGIELTSNAKDISINPHRSTRGVLVDEGVSSVPVENLVFDESLSSYEGVSLRYAFNTRGQRHRESLVSSPFTFTVNSSTDVVTTSAVHPLVNGNTVELTTSGTLPDPLVTSTTYYVVSSNADTLKLAATAGGTAIDFTDTGSGTHTLTPTIEPNIKTGSEAIRCKAITTGNTLHRVAFDFPTKIASDLAGENFTFGCWIYVPEIANYQGSTPPLRPAIVLYDGVTSFVTNSGSQGYLIRPGGWQWIDIQGTLSSAATGIQLRVDIVGSAPGSGTSDGSEYIILDSVYLAKGYHSMAKMINSSAILSKNLTITAGDTTPSVYGVSTIKTANTGATTISDFDDPVDGQELVVIIDDGNTTIDFTSSGLIGNGGSDWSPANGDSMNCVYDGTDWICIIHDNTP